MRSLGLAVDGTGCHGSRRNGWPTDRNGQGFYHILYAIWRRHGANESTKLRRPSALTPRHSARDLPRGLPTQSLRLIADNPYQKVPAGMVRGALRERTFGEGRIHMVGR
jgi:hypothetical protein